MALAGALTLIALPGCSKHSSAPDGNKVVAGETYEEFDQGRNGLNGSHGSFARPGCTRDCGGHKAGYAWSEKKGITDPDQCGGKSWSFIEGCKAYAERASADGSAESE